MFWPEHADLPSTRRRLSSHNDDNGCDLHRLVFARGWSIVYHPLLILDTFTAAILDEDFAQSGTPTVEMDISHQKPYTSHKLVPDWALKLTSAPKLETSAQKKQHPQNAPKAPAAMSPVLPHNVQGKRNSQRLRRVHRIPPHSAVSIIDFANTTPTRQDFQPVVVPENETVDETMVVAAEEDRDVTHKDTEEPLGGPVSAPLRWSPMDVKEFVPQSFRINNDSGNGLDSARANAQECLVENRQNQQKYQLVYPQHFPSNDVFEEIDLDTWEERKREYQRHRQAEITPIGYKFGKQTSVPAVVARRQVDNFEYSPAQQKKDYALLMQGSESDESEPVYGLSYAPKFQYWSAWRDEFTDRFIDAVYAEHAQMSYLLDEAFEVVQQSGLNLSTDGLEEVKKLVEVGHDFSQQGSQKFNEHMICRIRNKMMREAGVWRRISLDRERYWFTGE